MPILAHMAYRQITQKHPFQKPNKVENPLIASVVESLRNRWVQVLLPKLKASNGFSFGFNAFAKIQTCNLYCIPETRRKKVAGPPSERS